MENVSHDQLPPTSLQRMTYYGMLLAAVISLGLVYGAFIALVLRLLNARLAAG
ncbi:MAG: hypothetical protein ACKOC5_10405 [Chloroflexota bacterium]